MARKTPKSTPETTPEDPTNPGDPDIPEARDKAVEAFQALLADAKAGVDKAVTDATKAAGDAKAAADATVKPVADRVDVNGWLDTHVTAALGRPVQFLKDAFEPTLNELRRAQDDANRKLEQARFEVKRTTSIKEEVDAALNTDAPPGIVDLSVKEQVCRARKSTKITTRLLDTSLVKHVRFGSAVTSDITPGTNSVVVNAIADGPTLTDPLKVQVALLDANRNVIAYTREDVFTYIPDPTLNRVEPADGTTAGGETLRFYYRNWNGLAAPDMSQIHKILLGQEPVRDLKAAGTKGMETVWEGKSPGLLVPASVTVKTHRQYSNDVEDDLVAPLPNGYSFHERRVLLVTPLSGPVGTEVMLKLDYFPDVERVEFGGTFATDLSKPDANTVICKVPAGVGPGNVLITVFSSDPDFTVTVRGFVVTAA